MFQIYDEPDVKVIVYTPYGEETTAKMRQLLACHRASTGK